MKNDLSLRTRVTPLRPLGPLAYVLAVLLGCGGPLSLEFTPAGAPVDATEPIRVGVVRLASSGQVYETAIAFGVAKPQRQSTLRFTKNGRVSEVSKQAGDRVAAGERIAELYQAGVEAEQKALESRLAAAREELAGMTRGVDSFGEGERRSRLEQEIRTIDRRIQELQREADLGSIDAPYDGVLASCSIEVGDMVNAGTEAFEVLADGPPVFKAHVPDRIAATLSAGAAVVVQLGPQQVAARILSVSPLLDRSSLTRLVRFAPVDAANGLSWTPGQSVEARFQLLSEKSGYWLPVSALQGEAGGLWAVYAVVPGESADVLARRPAEVLLMEDERVLVEGSLREGDLIVSEGVHRVVPRQRVTPVLLENIDQPSGLE